MFLLFQNLIFLFGLKYLTPKFLVFFLILFYYYLLLVFRILLYHNNIFFLFYSLLYNHNYLFFPHKTFLSVQMLSNNSILLPFLSIKIFLLFLLFPPLFLLFPLFPVILYNFFYFSSYFYLPLILFPSKYLFNKSPIIFTSAASGIFFSFPSFLLFHSFSILSYTPILSSKTSSIYSLFVIIYHSVF